MSGVPILELRLPFDVQIEPTKLEGMPDWRRRQLLRVIGRIERIG